MSDQVIHTVVLDIGGVLCSNPLVEFAAVDEDCGLPPGTTESVFRSGAEFTQVELGKLSLDDFFDELVRKFRSNTEYVYPATGYTG